MILNLAVNFLLKIVCNQNIKFIRQRTSLATLISQCVYSANAISICIELMLGNLLLLKCTSLFLSAASGQALMTPFACLPFMVEDQFDLALAKQLFNTSITTFGAMTQFEQWHVQLFDEDATCQKNCFTNFCLGRSQQLDGAAICQL